MESLPVELLNQICGYLCFHCQHPGLFPNADHDHIRNDKRALAHLCRTSKYLCSIAQPILYHYYATGNSRGRDEEEPPQTVYEYDYFLPQFVRTIAQRPDLASQITTMHLVDTSDVDYRWHESHVQTIEPLLEVGIVKDGLLKKPSPPDSWRVPYDLLGDSEQAGRRYTDFPHRWLAILAVVLSPRLKSLYLDAIGGFCLHDLRHSPRIKLLSLQTLGLVSRRFAYENVIHDGGGLFLAAPNLETIYVHSASPRGALPSHAPWWFAPCSGYYDYKTFLSKVTKLAASNLWWGDITSMLRSTSKLEELELYWEEHGNGESHCLLLGNVVDLLEPVKATITRLCIGCIPCHDEIAEYRHQERTYYYKITGSFCEYPKLEYMSIDCYSLYRIWPESDKLLVDLLPRPIRFLRISYAYSPWVCVDIAKCLGQLVKDAPEKFPFLKEVVLGVLDDPSTNLDFEVLGLFRDFQSSDIKLTVVYDPPDADPRTVVPGDMIGPKSPPVPRIRDMLEKEAEESI
ncbi:hypothetical protein F5B19DRAFT_464587 [Rostrohypoxylon terebratum]|nr:hypothetical protein F5B19DRAFT_464587 [Rostrohypoxylon terebratum]